MPLLNRGAMDAGAGNEPIVTGWAAFSNGNAQGFASVRTTEWNCITPVHACDTPVVLDDLTNDPDENTDVAAAHPAVVRNLLREVEAVVGQPLPARMNEVCDPETFPMAKYLRHRQPPEAI